MLNLNYYDTESERERFKLKYVKLGGKKLFKKKIHYPTHPFSHLSKYN